MVVSGLETRISDLESSYFFNQNWQLRFFFLDILIRVEIEIGVGRRRCRVAVWGARWRGMDEGHFQVPCGVAVRDGRKQSI